MKDILFTAAAYKSAQHAIEFANSIGFVGENNYCVLATPIRSEIQEIVDGIKDCRNIAVLYSHIDNLYFCRAIGFLFALKRRMKFRYYCSCDDDIEFTENSRKILGILDKTEFSVMTFCNVKRRINGELVYGPAWINGDSMFSHFSENLQYGLPDSLPNEPVTFFTEVEYQHRMRWLTGRPIVVDRRAHYYKHNSRNENDPITKIRDENSSHKMNAGNRFWKEKYGIDVNFSGGGNHEAVYNRTMNHKNEEKMKSHLIFDGMWNNWDEIIAEYSKYWDEIWVNGKWA